MNWIWLALTAALTAGAARAEQAPPPMPDPVTLTERNNSQTVTVHVGQPVVVTLAENASTGYRWAIDQIDPNLVEAREGTAHYPPAGTIGAGGRAEWIFTPKTAGTTSVGLKQWRSWEGDASVVARFQVRLDMVP